MTDLPDGARWAHHTATEREGPEHVSEPRQLAPLFTWRSAMADSDLDPTTRHVALAVSLYMNERGGSAFPGAAKIAHDTGLTVRSVRTHLAVLVDRGWLELVDRGGLKGQVRRANEYRTAVPDPTETREPGSPISDSDEGTSFTGERPSRVNLTTATGESDDTDPCTTFTPTHQEYSKTSPSGPLSTTTASKKKRTSKARRTPPPDTFEVTPDLRAWARANHIRCDLAATTEQFLDHHRAKGSTMADWTSAWRTWMRNVKKWGGVDGPADDPNVMVRG